MPYWIEGRDRETGEVAAPFFSDAMDERAACAEAESQGLIIEVVDEVAAGERQRSPESSEGVVRSPGVFLSAFVATVLALLAFKRRSTDLGLAIGCGLALLSFCMALYGLRAGMVGLFEGRPVPKAGSDRASGVLQTDLTDDLGIVWNELILVGWIVICLGIYIGF